MDSFDSSDSNAERFAHAVLHRLHGDYKAAEGLLQAILKERPTDAAAVHELGLIYSYQAEMDKSLAALERAVSLEPTSRTYRMDLAKTYIMFGDADKAAAIMQRLDEGGTEGNANP